MKNGTKWKQNVSYSSESSEFACDESFEEFADSANEKQRKKTDKSQSKQHKQLQFRFTIVSKERELRVICQMLTSSSAHVVTQIQVFGRCLGIEYNEAEIRILRKQWPIAVATHSWIPANITTQVFKTSLLSSKSTRFFG